MDTLPTTSNAVISVAVLDDQLFVREAICAALQTAGLRVVGRYAEGEAFLRGLDSEPPRAAILDLILRETSGLAVLEVAQRRHPEIPVLVLSGSVEPGIVERCFELGASGYLDKATTHAGAIVEALNGIVSGKRIFPMQAMESLADLSVPGESSGRRVLNGISTREREVLAHVAEGADNLKISALLNISERTVRAHVSNLYRKLNVENRTQMALLAQKLRLTLEPKLN
ncbi:MAG: response regulator transcription factor [Myxococcaceae bacterium]